jgi:flagellar basal-body rod protein FlgC
MGIFSNIDIASSGLSAQRLRLDVISDNIANVNTTRTPEGGLYRRSRVIFRPRVSQPYWRSPFLPKYLDNGVGKGVKVAKIEKDMDKPKLVWNPTHPDAHQTGELKGYVEFPNTNIANEMVDMMSATRSYEANISMINGTKSMFLKALEIGR